MHNKVYENLKLGFIEVIKKMSYKEPKEESLSLKDFWFECEELALTRFYDKSESFSST